MTRYRIYGVDRAGNSWIEAMRRDPIDTLLTLKDCRMTEPYNHFHVVDADNEDYGDMEARLQELADGGEE